MSSSLSLKTPLSLSEIDNLRLVMRKQVPKYGIGAHLHRRMGQSLEFREFRDYVFGDDIRKVDWAASQRRGLKNELVIRTFEAEERRTVLILLDCRATMMLPDEVEKIIVAGWLAQSLSLAALTERDRLYVGTIYGDSSPIPINSRAQIVQIEKLVARQIEKKKSKDYWQQLPKINVSKLISLLKPASVVILISDMLMRHDLNELKRLGQLAQQSYRTLHIIEVDTWLLERHILQSNPFALEDIEDITFDKEVYESKESFIQEIGKNLDDQRKKIRELLSGRSLVWPETPFAYDQEIAMNSKMIFPWFRTNFRKAQFLPSLLSRKG